MTTGYIVLTTPPQSDTVVLLGLGMLFLTLAVTLGLIIYAVRSHQLPHWQDRRTIFREGLGLALAPSIVFTLFLLLRYFALDRPLNIGLLLLLGAAYEAYLIRRR